MPRVNEARVRASNPVLTRRARRTASSSWCCRRCSCCRTCWGSWSGSRWPRTWSSFGNGPGAGRPGRRHDRAVPAVGVGGRGVGAGDQPTSPRTITARSASSRRRSTCSCHPGCGSTARASTSCRGRRSSSVSTGRWAPRSPTCSRPGAMSAGHRLPARHGGAERPGCRWRSSGCRARARRRCCGRSLLAYPPETRMVTIETDFELGLGRAGSAMGAGDAGPAAGDVEGSWDHLRRSDAGRRCAPGPR